MLSMIPPMVGATVVIGVSLLSYSDDTALKRSSVLADNMRHYHQASVASVRQSQSPVTCGLLVPDLGRYRAVIDWESRIERADGGSHAFVITYPTNLTATNGVFTAQELASLSLAVKEKKVGFFRTATWDATSVRPSDGFVRPNAPAFGAQGKVVGNQPNGGARRFAKGFAEADFSGDLQIPNGASVIMTRVGTCTV